MLVGALAAAVMAGAIVAVPALLPGTLGGPVPDRRDNVLAKHITTVLFDLDGTLLPMDQMGLYQNPTSACWCRRPPPSA